MRVQRDVFRHVLLLLVAFGQCLCRPSLCSALVVTDLEVKAQGSILSKCLLVLGIHLQRKACFMCRNRNKKVTTSGIYSTSFFLENILLECFNDRRQFLFFISSGTQLHCLWNALFLFPEGENKRFYFSKVLLCRFELMSK